MNMASDPGGLGRRERKKIQRREQIIATAVEAFDRHGFDGVSVEAIADTADVSLRTLYNFFPTKLDLLVAGSARAAMRELESALGKLGDPPPAPRDGINRWIEAHFRVYAAMDRDVLLRTTLHGVAQGPKVGAGSDYAQVDMMTMSSLRSYLDIYVARGTLSDPDLDGLARLIFAAANGEFFLWVADRELPVEAALERMRNHLDRALA